MSEQGKDCQARTGSEAPAPRDYPADATAFVLDGKGGVLRQAEGARETAVADPGFSVIVGSPASPDYRSWLDGELGATAAELLTEGGERTRCQIFGDRAALILQVTRSGSEPEDMERQPMGVWIEKGRVVIATDVDVPGLLGWADSASLTHLPQSPGDFVARLGLRVADRLEPLLEELDEDLDDIDELTLLGRTRDNSDKLAAFRHLLVGYRRLIWPLRDALLVLELEELSIFSHKDRAHLRQASQRTMRLGDELHALSERAVLVHEHALDQRADQMNRAMLILAIVTTVFLPLTLITGMFGMNLPGIPFFTNPAGFWIVVGLMAVLAVLLALWFFRRKWFND